MAVSLRALTVYSSTTIGENYGYWRCVCRGQHEVSCCFGHSEVDWLHLSKKWYSAKNIVISPKMVLCYYDAQLCLCAYIALKAQMQDACCKARLEDMLCHKEDQEEE